MKKSMLVASCMAVLTLWPMEENSINIPIYLHHNKEAGFITAYTYSKKQQMTEVLKYANGKIEIHVPKDLSWENFITKFPQKPSPEIIQLLKEKIYAYETTLNK